MRGRVAGAVPVQVGATLAPGATVVLGDGGLEDFAAVGPRHPLLAAPDRQLPADVRLHRQRLDTQLLRLEVQRTADAALEAGPVEEDAGALVLSGAQVGLVVILVHLEIAPAAQALFPELPILVRQLLHRSIEPLAVVLVGQERAVRAAAVNGPTLDGALTPRRAENARTPRQQPSQIGGDHVLGIVGVVELHPFTGEIQLDLAGMF